jgi:hypothetical protein
MKLVKFGIFAMALGLFTASCGGDSTTEEGTDMDTTVVAPMTEPAPTMDAAPVDTTSTMGTGMDTTGAMGTGTGTGTNTTTGGTGTTTTPQ